MPWLQPFADPTLAELAARSSISGGGGISSGLLRPPPNQWLEALNQVAPVIRDYIQKKKSDEIANQLMNMQQPPRAEAIDYPQGIPATEPFTGGADQFKVAEMYRQRMEHREDRDLNRRYKESQINAKGESRVPIQIDGETYHVTPNAALEHFDRVRKGGDDGLTAYQREQLRLRGEDKLHKSIPPYSRALRRGKIEDGDFTNNYAEAATGDMTEVETPDGSKIIVPWSEYERATKGPTNPAAESYRGVQQQPPRAKWKESPSEDFRPTTSYEQPSATSSKDNLKTRAKAALADPEATEEEKAAAKRILGL